MPVTVQFGSFGGIGASSGFSPCPACRSRAAARRSAGVRGGGATSCSFSEVYSRSESVRSYLGARILREPGADRRPGRLGPAGGLVVEVPDDVVEQVAPHFADLPLAHHVGPHAGDVRTEAGAGPGALRRVRRAGSGRFSRNAFRSGRDRVRIGVGSSTGT